MIKRKNKKSRRILKALFGWITLCFFRSKGRSRLLFFVIKIFYELEFSKIKILFYFNFFFSRIKYYYGK